MEQPLPGLKPLARSRLQEATRKPAGQQLDMFYKF